MKGIILAGGTGSRLYPLTKIINKQLQAVYDKPMIYYPLTTLIAAGIRDLCIILNPNDLEDYQTLLGDGSNWGINLSYILQDEPKGIAEAFVLAENFLDGSCCTLILGDNIFSGGSDIPDAIKRFSEGATVFAYQVPNPEQYGVLGFDKNMKVVSIEEKPFKPKSNYVIPGIYIFDNNSVRLAKTLTPSLRGELEITELVEIYLKQDKLSVHRLSRGYAWLDSGNSESLFEASNYIATIEKRQGIKIGCPEEAALVRGFVTKDKLYPLIDNMPKCSYRDYLLKMLNFY